MGPAIIACNHASYLDPVANGYAMVRAGRRPRFLAKEDLFRIPIVGTALRGARQIPVARGTRDRSSLRRAVAALEEGEVIVVYPEGTVTKREDGLPMEGKTGTVGLALQTGVPIMPMASWGSQAVWQKSGKGSLKFGRPIWTTVGRPFGASRGARPGAAEAPRADRSGDGGDHATCPRPPGPISATVDEVGSRDDGAGQEAAVPDARRAHPQASAARTTVA